MKNPHVIWASVAIIFLMIAGVVMLAALGKPTDDVTNLAVLLGLPVLGGMGAVAYQRVSQGMDQIKDQANGRITDLINLTRELQSQVTQLALRVPAGSDLLSSTFSTKPLPASDDHSS